jgi:hypothetical protein
MFYKNKTWILTINVGAFVVEDTGAKGAINRYFQDL